MRYAISTTSFGGDLIESLRAASSAGFDGVELFWDDLIHSGYSFSAIKKCLDDLGLSVESVQPIRSFEGKSAEEQRIALKNTEKFFEIAALLEARVVVLCANEEASACDPEQATLTLSEIARKAKSYKIDVAFEGLAWSYKIKNLSDVWRAVSLCNVDNLGLVLDNFHFSQIKDSLKELVDIPIQKIFIVQLSRFVENSKISAIENSRRFRDIPIERNIVIDEILKKLILSNYDRVVSLEMFSDRLRNMPPYEVAKESYKHLRRILSGEC